MTQLNGQLYAVEVPEGTGKLQNVSKERPVIAWWSGGITSAVVCWLAIQIFGAENVRIIFIDTKNEHPDTYRFKNDCEGWYGKEVETATRIGKDYGSIKDVWYKYLSLNVATGAICSAELKREVRVRLLKEIGWSYNAFGFEIDEVKRIRGMVNNYGEINPIFLLALYGMNKKHCFQVVADAGIEPPQAYKLGFNNNNCLEKYGCVQGGIGYWQHMQKVLPENVDRMAVIEHELTDLKGEPVTMLKDQSKGGGLVFLKPHPNYPHIKDSSMMKGRPPRPLVECNGFCGINDMAKRNPTEKEINYQS